MGPRGGGKGRRKAADLRGIRAQYSPQKENENETNATRKERFGRPILGQKIGEIHESAWNLRINGHDRGEIWEREGKFGHLICTFGWAAKKCKTEDGIEVRGWPSAGDVRYIVSECWSLVSGAEIGSEEQKRNNSCSPQIGCVEGREANAEEE